MVKEIPLQNGMVAFVDDEDFKRASKYIWTATINGSKLRVMANSEGKTIPLNRFVLKIECDNNISFKDNNPLNCTKDNLVLLAHKNILRASKGRKNTTSKYKGVFWRKDRRKWRASILVDGKKLNLGSYDSEDEAAKAYNEAALKYFGEFGYLNVIGEDNSIEISELKKVIMKRRVGKTGFKGVKSSGKRWRADITINKKPCYLGTFNTSEEAARTYDKKAYELHGDKAILNFPEEYKKSI